MTRAQIVIIIVLLTGSHPCLSAEFGKPGDERLLSKRVKPINWTRFKGPLPRSRHRELSALILLNSAKWGSGWIEKEFKLSEEEDRYLVPNQNSEHVIRPGCSVAAGLAVVIKTGLIKTKPEAFAVDERELTMRTVKLIKGLAVIHKANGGKWGDHCKNKGKIGKEK